MTPQERDVIAGIFDRLKQAADQPRDPEAERFIADKLRDQPYAPYAMAQAVYVQEQALTNLQAQVEQLQEQVRDLEQRRPEPQGGGFLSGIFGGGRSEPERPRSVPSMAARGAGSSGAWSNQSQPAGGLNAAPMQQGAMQQGMPPQGQPGPWGNQAAAQQAPGRGSGFLGTALTTAAGVAGGMVAGNMLMNAFKGDGGAAQAATPAAGGDAGNAQTAADNSTYNDGSSDSANYQNASHEQPADQGYDDGSSDFGGGDDDWA